MAPSSRTATTVDSIHPLWEVLKYITFWSFTNWVGTREAATTGAAPAAAALRLAGGSDARVLPRWNSNSRRASRCGRTAAASAWSLATSARSSATSAVGVSGGSTAGGASGCLSSAQADNPPVLSTRSCSTAARGIDNVAVEAISVPSCPTISAGMEGLLLFGPNILRNGWPSASCTLGRSPGLNFSRARISSWAVAWISGRSGKLGPARITSGGIPKPLNSKGT
mmetsp:Transcript_52677/g.139991  ORF Transcript_52677/g.139991 Transcript_52677/m.139991 type:complete len:225 (-) Transcript_52677:624-1298(-)